MHENKEANVIADFEVRPSDTFQPDVTGLSKRSGTKQTSTPWLDHCFYPLHRRDAYDLMVVNYSDIHSGMLDAGDRAEGIQRH